jgi:hypothetical protein
MARHFGQTASFEQTKSMTYLTRVRSNCRRSVKAGHEPLRSYIDESGQLVEEFLPKTYKNSHYQSENDLSDYTEWNEVSIADRHRKIVEFAMTRWPS